MKKLALVIMFSLLATSAFAQNWGSNNIGVYLDAGAESNCGLRRRFHPLLPGRHRPGDRQRRRLRTEADGRAARLSARSILCTRSTPPTWPTRPNEWFVGFAEPAPTSDGSVVFMSFNLFVTGDLAPTELFIDPIYFASIPGSCAYLDGADYNIQLPLFNSTGDPVTGATVPVLTLNGQCAVPSEDASWGEVKSLFR